MSFRAARRAALRGLLHGALATEPAPCAMDRATWLSLQPALLVHGAAALAFRRVPETLARDPALQPLRDAARLHALRARAYQRACLAAVDALDQAGIPFLLLKGWTLARLYPAPGLRPYGDLDVLVAPAHAVRARYALLRDDPGRAPLVDLHTSLEELPGSDAESLIARGQPLVLGGRTLHTLGAPDLGLHLCAHWLKHGGARPTWLCDVALLLAQPDAERMFAPLLHAP